MTIDTWKKKATVNAEKPVNGLVATLVCIICVTCSGMLAIKLNDPDQGKLVTLDEMQIRIRDEVERIQNDPHIPARVKNFALGMLSRGRIMGVDKTQRQHH